MKEYELTPADNELIEAAKKIITDRYMKPFDQKIGTAIRMKSGNIFTSINLRGPTGNTDICAEPIVLGSAVSKGESDFETIVSVKYPKDPEEEIKISSPCGHCRELLCKYDVEYTIVNSDGRNYKVKTEDLLPVKYSK